MKGHSLGTLARGIVYLTVSRCAFFLSGIVIHLGLSRLLDKSAYGAFGVLLGLLSIGQTLMMGGSSYAVSKFVAAYPDRRGSVVLRCFRLQLWLGIPAMLGFIVSAPLIASYFKDTSLMEEIRIVGLMLPVYGAFVVFSAALNGMRLFGYQAATQVTFSVFKVILVFALVVMGLGISGVVVGYIGAAGIATVMAVVFVRPHLGRGPLSIGTREIAQYALPVLVSSALSMLFLQMDLFLVKRILSDQAMTAEYTAAAAFGKIPFYLSTSVAIAVFPSVAGAVARKDREQIQSYIRAPMRYTLIAMSLVAVCLATTSNQFVGLLYPAQYAMAYIPLGMLAGAIGVYSLLMLGCTIMNAAGKPKASILAMSVALIGSYTGCTVFIPRMGIMGAAVGVAVGASAGLVFIGTIVYANFRTLCSPLTVLRTGIAAVGAYSVGRMVVFEGVLLIVSYAAIAAVFFGILWIGREIKKEDVRLLGSAVGLMSA